MNELLKKDAAIRVVAILFAVILWFYANPIEKQTFSVPITFLNENSLAEKGLVLKNKSFQNDVLISVRGREDRIAKLRNIDFEALVDFSKIKSVNDTEIEIDGPYYRGKEQNISVVDVKSTKIKVELEQIDENPFRVEIVTNGKVSENYTIVKITAMPEIVSLQDRESLIEQIGSVKAYIDVTGLKQDKVFRQSCKIYYKNGKEMTELVKPIVDIKVEVAKEVPVVPFVNGSISGDYVEMSREIKPGKVLLTGSPEILDGISQILTEPINIEGLTSTSNLKVMLNLPDGVKLFDSKREVTLTIGVEKLEEKQFIIPREQIGINNAQIDSTFKYSINNESVNVALKGLRNVVNKLTIGDLNPNIDVKGLGKGTHVIPLIINVPPNIKLMHEYTVEVVVDEVQP